LDVSSSDFLAATFSKAFDVYQVVRLTNVPSTMRSDSVFSWKDMEKLFEGLEDADKKSWCVETTDAATPLQKTGFLQPRRTKERAYCSFVVQHDKTSYKDTFERLPVPKLDFADHQHENALWMFFGRNPPGSPALQGRKEHTDSVSHDGTWHYQLSGTKQWIIRPSPDLVSHLRRCHPSNWSPETRLSVECQKGDVLVINTKLWFHQTIIPAQRDPSVSYARDFFSGKSQPTDNQDPCMDNVEGSYAASAIESGTIICTEETAPDCDFHRSLTHPNCEMVVLEDGLTTAVVSTKDIPAGDFFCLPESSDDNYMEGDSDDEDEMED
jgi:hypothetical protein